MPNPFEGVPLAYSDFNDLPSGENPLSDGGRWSNDGDRPPLMVRVGGGSIHGTVEFAVNGSLYVEKVFRGDIIEVYACTPGTGLGAALESQRVALWTNPDARTGYSIGWGGGIGEEFFLRRYDSNAFVGIGGAHTRDDHPDLLGLRITPTEVQAWGNYLGVWEQVVTAADTTHRGTFWAALETEEQGGIEEVGFSCFGGGIPNRSQFFRWLQN